MAFASGLSKFGRVFAGLLVLAGFLVIGNSLLQLIHHPIGPEWLLLAALTLISGSASVKLPWAHVRISISEAFVFTAVLLYGSAAGTLTVALDGLVISFWIAKSRPELDRALINISAPAVSAWCSSRLFFLVAGITPLVQGQASLDQILPALVLFALTYYGLNSAFIAIVIAAEKRLRAWDVWRTGFIWLSLNYFCGASLAVLLVGYNRTIDLKFVGVVVPLLLVLYFTFKTSMERVADADRHVEELNTLYLSTIETLAMAIDAKDQITHGHIRRVQAYAVGLGQKAGVTDRDLIRALEAAALLHDMGKLAVPEYILNKPGKLTAFEFEKMKLHASVGADILSAIDFPYPVVPIVRHHHENWDGTGYPSGLRGTEIPIGARILSVVDCFDALTSDRPYRPRLSDEDAIGILLQRRGTMYDPLIVDTFMNVYHELAHPIPATRPPRSALNEIVSARQSNLSVANALHLDEIAASADEMLTLYELARALAGHGRASDRADVIAKHARRLIPFSLCIFYRYDVRTGELEVEHATGDRTHDVKGMRIALGQRLSGWVAANRQTIVNSDPTLDLGDVARSANPRLRSCLSTPLIVGDELVGVLALYSSTVDGFTDDHRRIVEAVAKQMADVFQGAPPFETATRRDETLELPSIAQLEHFENIGSRELISQGQSALLFVGIINLGEINVRCGIQVGREVVQHVVSEIRARLRPIDVLFSHGSAEFVVLLNDATPNVAQTLARDIRHSVQERRFGNRTGIVLSADIVVTVACSPGDGESLSKLLDVARRDWPQRSTPDGPSVH